MYDFDAARTKMVDGQLRPNEVTEWPLLDAILAVPRERFVPAGRRELAYADVDLPVTEDGAPARALLQPMVLARLIQALDVHDNDAVLDVGCTTGYAAAVLSRLARRVVALEEDAGLAEAASANVAALGQGNVDLVQGPLAGGHAGGRYDAILVEGAVEFLPDALLDQLADGGRLAVVVGFGKAGEAMLYRRTGAEVSGSPIMNAAAPALPGFVRPPAFAF